MNFILDIKRYLKRALPRPLVLYLKKVRHTKKISTVTAESDADFTPLQHLIKPGDSIVDLGANMGFYTKFFSELVGAQGHVYSIEPIPSTVEILRYMVKKLGLANVQVIHCAVSDKNGSVTMEIPLFESGEENIFEAKIIDGPTSSGFEKVTVDAKTIDTLFNGKAQNITFIKCDIEGHELTALKGARGFLTETKPAWLVEVWGNPDQSGSDASKTFDVFKEAGYHDYWFEGSIMRRRQKGEKSVNYFFLTEAHVNVLRQHFTLADQTNVSTT